MGNNNSLFKRQYMSVLLIDTLYHKVLTYVEYRAVSGVFINIDPPPPLSLASVSSPLTKGGGGTHSPGGEEVGVNILEDARQYIPSTLFSYQSLKNR